MEEIEMSRIEFDTLGDKCKAGEDVETLRKAASNSVVMVRLDGHGFSKFTRGLARPYDERMSKFMVDAVTFIIEQTHAVVGFTQSDEITLVFKAEHEDIESVYFGGRFQKIATTCASLATAFFNKHLADRIPEKAEAYPCFDGRAWEVPSIKEAYENLLWRERDATKNSITMAASSMFSHKSLHGVSGETKKQMMLKQGVDWNDYPAFFKRGTYVKRVTIKKQLTDMELQRIPEGRRPTGPVERSVVVALSMPQINALDDYASCLFEKKMPNVVKLRNGGDFRLY